jgi:hypothetical protein
MNEKMPHPLCFLNGSYLTGLGFFPETAKKVSVLLGNQTTRGPQNLGGPGNQQDVKASQLWS